MWGTVGRPLAEEPGEPSAPQVPKLFLTRHAAICGVEDRRLAWVETALVRKNRTGSNEASITYA
jgi:hypothetical protein